jgi:hypothetical protein
MNSNLASLNIYFKHSNLHCVSNSLLFLKIKMSMSDNLMIKIIIVGEGIL